jgi:hypothetical protein
LEDEAKNSKPKVGMNVTMSQLDWLIIKTCVVTRSQKQICYNYKKKTKEVSPMKGQCKQKKKKQIHQDIVDELQNIQINNDLLQSCLVTLWIR